MPVTGCVTEEMLVKSMEKLPHIARKWGRNRGYNDTEELESVADVALYNAYRSYDSSLGSWRQHFFTALWQHWHNFLQSRAAYSTPRYIRQIDMPEDIGFSTEPYVAPDLVDAFCRTVGPLEKDFVRLVSAGYTRREAMEHTGLSVRKKEILVRRYKDFLNNQRTTSN